jgi:hypothetical protein
MNSTTLAVAASKPVPAIVMQQQIKKDWEQLVNQITELAKKEDDCALNIGDLLHEIKDEWGNQFVQEAAKASGISMSVARQRLWVSSKIPKEHFLRDTHLTYGQLRLIAGTSDVDFWGKQALGNGWDLKQLKTAIEEAGDKKAQEDGHPCVQCAEALNDQQKIVAFTVQGEKRHRACSVKCAADYFFARSQEPQTATEDEDGPMSEKDFDLA